MVTYSRSSGGTYSGVHVLKELIIENFYHHEQEDGNDISQYNLPAKQNLLAVFNPDNDVWKCTILKKGGQLFQQHIDFMTVLHSFMHWKP